MKGSRFRALRIATPQLVSEAVLLRDALCLLREDHASGALNDATTALLFTLLFHQKRATGAGWIPAGSGAHRARVRSREPAAARYGLHIPNGVQMVFTHNLRHLPQTVMRALRVWLRHPRTLRLADRVVTAREMTQAQARGFRWVTLDWRAAMSGAWVDEDRDSFEFLLHDLAHAGHFLADGPTYRAQIAFYRAVSLWADAGEWDEYLTDAEFRRQFDYLAADMNTHYAHSLFYLRAILTGFYLRLEKKPLGDKLSPENARKLDIYWRRWTAHARSVSDKFVIDQFIEHVDVAGQH